MAVALTEQQQKARELIKAIGGLDQFHVWVVSPPSEPKLRIQVQPCCRPRFFSKMLHEWGWRPTFVGMTHRTSDMGFSGCLVEVYELDVPDQLRTTLPADPRKIPNE